MDPRPEIGGLVLLVGGQRLVSGVSPSFVWRTLKCGSDKFADQPMTYTNWIPGEGGKLHESCLNIGTYFNNQWNDLLCTSQFCYLCQVDVN